MSVHVTHYSHTHTVSFAIGTEFTKLRNLTTDAEEKVQLCRDALSIILMIYN